MRNRNNIAEIAGTVVTAPVLGHNIYNEDFYNMEIEVPRLSGTADILPVTVSGKLLYGAKPEVGERILIRGQLRSYNKAVDSKNRLDVRVFALELEAADEVDDINEVVLEGYLCKKPIYRTTPFGREITDMLVAVNRPFGKSDYIPVIAWGRNARFISFAEVGEKVFISGRLQSRQYEKRFEDGTVIKRTAYELSANTLEMAEEDME